MIKDLRTLKAFEKRFNLKFDKYHKYSVGDDIGKIMTYKNSVGVELDYELKYFDGCFYPFLCSVEYEVYYIDFGKVDKKNKYKFVVDSSFNLKTLHNKYKDYKYKFGIKK